MKRACCGAPDGPLIEADEFFRRYGADYRQKGTLPYCPSCAQALDLYGAHSTLVETRFDHPNLPADADPLDDCRLADRAPDRLKTLRPKDIDKRQSIDVRRRFFEDDNLRRAYAFCFALCGRHNLPAKKFHSITKRADKQGIWSYKDMPLWVVPYIFLTLEDFSTEHYGFRFAIDKKTHAPLDDIWLTKSPQHLLKVFADSGNILRSGRIPNPLPITEENIEKIAGTTTWVRDDFLILLRNDP